VVARADDRRPRSAARDAVQLADHGEMDRLPARLELLGLFR
jgi:hypothetical protein